MLAAQYISHIDFFASGFRTIIPWLLVKKKTL
jgi:hypothetical protein